MSFGEHDAVMFAPLRRRWAAFLAGVCVVVVGFPGIVSLQLIPILEVGNFSAARAGGLLSDDWKPLTFIMIKDTDY